MTSPKRKTADYEITVLGIPAGVVITSYSPGYEAKINCLPEDAYEGASAEIEFILIDRKGYKAQWLMDKLSTPEWYDLEKEVLGMVEA